MTPAMPEPERLQRLRDYFAQHQAIPSYSGIAELMGYRSKAAAYKLVARLTQAGFLKIGPSKRPAPTKRFFGHRLVGPVRAGNPEIPPDVGFEMLNIEEYLIERPSQRVF